MNKRFLISSPEWRYNLLIESEDYPNQMIDLGNEKGWIKKHEVLLDNADRISLIPKDQFTGKMPIISVELDNTKRWVFFTKVAGPLMDASKDSVRVYCIGWQMNVDGKNIKSLTWVYPSGIVENSEKPNHINKFIM